MVGSGVQHMGFRASVWQGGLRIEGLVVKFPGLKLSIPKGASSIIVRT